MTVRKIFGPELAADQVLFPLVAPLRGTSNGVQWHLGTGGEWSGLTSHDAERRKMRHTAEQCDEGKEFPMHPEKWKAANK